RGGTGTDCVQLLCGGGAAPGNLLDRPGRLGPAAGPGLLLHWHPGAGARGPVRGLRDSVRGRPPPVARTARRTREPPQPLGSFRKAAWPTSFRRSGGSATPCDTTANAYTTIREERTMPYT